MSAAEAVNDEQAQWDSGTGWNNFSSRTIPLYSNVLKFRGDWRQGETGKTAPKGSYMSLFEQTFNFGQEYSINVYGGLYVEVSAANRMFGNMFRHNTSLTGKIPSDLFAGVSGTIPLNTCCAFTSTFLNCSFTDWPDKPLWNSIGGNVFNETFMQTFYGLKIAKPIPANIFPPNMNYLTANNHSFAGAFANGLYTGVVPAGLFRGANQTRANIYESLFENCVHITGFEDGWIGELSTTKYDKMFVKAFYSMPSVTGNSPRVWSSAQNKYIPLYEHFSGATSAQVGGAFGGGTWVRFDDAANIPEVWK